MQRESSQVNTKYIRAAHLNNIRYTNGEYIFFRVSITSQFFVLRNLLICVTMV